MGVIEFQPDGTIIKANSNFLQLFGLQTGTNSGKPHRMFCTTDYVRSPNYERLWNTLRSGQVVRGVFQRLTARASQSGWRPAIRPYLRTAKCKRIVKLAYDITERVEAEAEVRSRLTALDRSMATIEFTPDGQILNANQNFLDVMGYTLHDLRGKTHRVFCEANYVQSTDYALFWSQLNQGQFFSGQYKRLRRSGSPVCWKRRITRSTTRKAC